MQSSCKDIFKCLYVLVCINVVMSVPFSVGFMGGGIKTVTCTELSGSSEGLLCLNGMIF